MCIACKLVKSRLSLLQKFCQKVIQKINKDKKLIKRNDLPSALKQMNIRYSGKKNGCELRVSWFKSRRSLSQKIWINKKTKM